MLLHEAVFKVEQVTRSTEEKLGDLFWEIFGKEEKNLRSPDIIGPVGWGGSMGTNSGPAFSAKAGRAAVSAVPIRTRTASRRDRFIFTPCS